MQQEQEMNQTTQAQATEEPAKEEPKVETYSTADHDVVGPGSTCSKCGWKWGDPETHIVTFETGTEPPKPSTAKPPGPNACDAIPLNATCPKCGWSATDPKTMANPHPVLT